MTTSLLWIIATIATLVVAAALIEAYVKRNRTRRLSDMRPDPEDISKIAGIERNGMDPVAMAQAEHRRLENEGWTPRLPDSNTTAASARKKETQND